MSDLICLGKIVAAHGIKGEVKVKSFTSNPKDICAYGKLSDKTGLKFFAPQFVGFSKELLRIKVNGINNRNDAEALVGTELYIERKKLPDLHENTFYQADLIGLKVYEKVKSDTPIGEVVGIYNFGAGDILEIRFHFAKQPEMIPFTDQYVSEINVKEGFILLSQASMTFFDDEEINHED